MCSEPRAASQSVVQAPVQQVCLPQRPPSRALRPTPLTHCLGLSLQTSSTQPRGARSFCGCSCGPAGPTLCSCTCPPRGLLLGAQPAQGLSGRELEKASHMHPPQHEREAWAPLLSTTWGQCHPLPMPLQPLKSSCHWVMGITSHHALPPNLDMSPGEWHGRLPLLGTSNSNCLLPTSNPAPSLLLPSQRTDASGPGPQDTVLCPSWSPGLRPHSYPSSTGAGGDDLSKTQKQDLNSKNGLKALAALALWTTPALPH